jgi:Kef-type K+ transport system membrane component KefB
LLLVLILLGVAYIVKSVPALMYRLEHSWHETLAAGILLSSRLSLIIAAAAIGLEQGLVSPAINAAVILVAVITCTVSPILFNRIVPTPAKAPDRVIVIGSGHSSALLMRRLSQQHLDAILVSGDAG